MNKFVSITDALANLRKFHKVRKLDLEYERTTDPLWVECIEDGLQARYYDLGYDCDPDPHEWTEVLDNLYCECGGNIFVLTQCYYYECMGDKKTVSYRFEELLY